MGGGQCMYGEGRWLGSFVNELWVDQMSMSYGGMWDVRCQRAMGGSHNELRSHGRVCPLTHSSHCEADILGADSTRSSSPQENQKQQPVNTDSSGAAQADSTDVEEEDDHLPLDAKAWFAGYPTGDTWADQTHRLEKEESDGGGGEPTLAERWGPAKRPALRYSVSGSVSGPGTHFTVSVLVQSVAEDLNQVRAEIEKHIRQDFGRYLKKTVADEKTLATFKASFIASSFEGRPDSFGAEAGHWWSAMMMRRAGGRSASVGDCEWDIPALAKR